MAIDPSASYTGQVDTSDPTGYPHGKARNSASLGDGIGWPLEKDWVNDLLGFQQALLASVGATPSGTPDKVGASQYLDALKAVTRTLQQQASSFRFTRVDLAAGTNSLTFLSAVQQTIAIGAPANREKQILVSGASAGSLSLLALLGNGTSPPSSFHSAAGSPFSSAPASDSSGTIFGGIVSGGVVSTGNAGATFASVAVSGLSAPATWVGATASRCLVFEGSTRKMYTATSLGGAWTNVVLSASSPASLSDLCTDGAGNWVLVATVSGSTLVFRSTDDGATFSLAQNLGSGLGGASGCWSADNGLFVVLRGAGGSGTLGELWSSPTGSVWTLRKTIAGLNGGFGQNEVAACGPAIAVLINRGPNSLGQYQLGVAITLDLGASWSETYFGPSESSSTIVTNLISANGRFYVIDGHSLYQSGLIVTPPSLFTGV